nr:MAG TPA: hypothetical protein [Caudoviricetes sp.]
MWHSLWQQKHGKKHAVSGVWHCGTFSPYIYMILFSKTLNGKIFFSL